MKKVFLTIIFTLSLFFYSCLNNVSNAGGSSGVGNGGEVITPWDGISEKEPKFENSTYYIYEASELFWIANKSTNYSFKNETVKLEKNINLNNHLFPSIATNSLKENTTETKGGRVFMGVFNGNHKKIMNLKIVKNKDSAVNTDFASFIGYIENGAVHDLTIASGLIESYFHASGIVYYITYNKNNKDSRIFSYVSNCVNYATIKGAKSSLFPPDTLFNISGIVGLFGGGVHISHSTNYGNIVYPGEKKDTRIGGIFGMYETIHLSSSNYVSNCYDVVSSKKYGYYENWYFEIWEKNKKIYPNP